MPKLPSLAPALTALRPTLQAPKDEAALSQYRRDHKGHNLYNSRRWRGSDGSGGRDGLRWQTLLAAGFTCAMCGKHEADTSRLVADHITPHRGDDALFWDASNLQCLCDSCHSGAKQVEESANLTASFHPSWLRPSSIPLTIVCGPPASGKSYYVRQNAGLSDITIDLDEIASGLSGQSLHGWDRKWLTLALRERNDMLGSLSRDPPYAAAWLIASEPRAKWRQWWQDTMRPDRIVVIEADEAQCLRQARSDPDRDLLDLDRLATMWWTKYERRFGDHRVSTAPGG